MNNKISINNNDVSIKIIRITEGRLQNKFIGNVLVGIKYNIKNNESKYWVTVQYLTPGGLKAFSDKYSLNKFEATVDHKEKTVLLGPIQGVQLEENIQNKGVGSYAFNELIKILKDICHDYTILPFEFTINSNNNDDMSQRITTFFDKFGIQTQFFEPNMKTGVAKAETPEKLNNYYNINKIRELNSEDYIYQLINEIGEYSAEIKKKSDELERLKQNTFNGIDKTLLIKYTAFAFIVAIIIIVFILS